MYTVNWKCGNCCGGLNFENREEAIDFAQLIGGTITVEIEYFEYDNRNRNHN